MTLRKTCTAQRGFSIIEAMVAFAVMAFGMLALIGFQMTMARNADVARQRTEAMRLAQEKMEELRIFVSTPSVTPFDWKDLPAGGEEQSDLPSTRTNTIYTRKWLLDDTSVASAGSTPGHRAQTRTVQVKVEWTDRAGESQSLTLNSVISKTDPMDIGVLTLPSVDKDALRGPNGRDIHIPFQAVKLGGTNSGKSKLTFGTDTLVFSDAGGDVQYSCTNQAVGTITDSTDLARTCTPTHALLLSGYISASAELPPAAYLRVRFVAGSRPDGSAQALDVARTPVCRVEDARDHNLDDTLTAFRAYLCLVPTVAHAAPQPPATLPPAGHHWSGRVELSTNTAEASSAKVCAFGDRPSSTAATVDNARHPPTYLFVKQSLDHQNFYLNSAGACPSGTSYEHQAALPAGCAPEQLIGGICPP